jgi:hypothetical protein
MGHDEDGPMTRSLEHFHVFLWNWAASVIHGVTKSVILTVEDVSEPSVT